VCQRLEVELREEMSRLKSERLVKETQINRLEMTTTEKADQINELHRQLRQVLCSRVYHPMINLTAVIVLAAAAHPAVPSLVSCRSLYFLAHSARRRAVCTVCLFLPTTAKDIPVSPVISGHHSLNFCTTFSWTLQQFRLF